MWIIQFLGWIVLCLAGCTQVDDQRPGDPFEQNTGPLPALSFVTDSTGVQAISFDSVASGGKYSLEIVPMAFHTIAVAADGKSVLLTPTSSRWHKDSTRYTICKNTRCREGKIVLVNRNFGTTPVDTHSQTNCTILPVTTYFVPFFGSVEVRNFLPAGATIIPDSIQTDFHQVQNEGDSILTYIAAGGATSVGWAWDTIRFSAQATGQCYRGKIALVLGDTSEPQARDDRFSVPSGSASWPETALTQNDKGLSGTLGNYQTRTAMDFNYSNRVMYTSGGTLTDTLVNGQRLYLYTRTAANALHDQFTYYFKNLTSGRITKATVWIDF